MKWYRVFQIDDSRSEVIIYKESLDSDTVVFDHRSLIELRFVENNSYVEGFCDCLKRFGYKKLNYLNKKEI